MTTISTIRELKNLDKNVTRLTLKKNFNKQIIIPQNVTKKA